MERKCKRKQKNSNPVPDTAEPWLYEDEVYFMAVALLYAEKSPDPNTKVGACIINQEGKIVGTGYNKVPNGCEEVLTLECNADNRQGGRYPYVCHAELNAIMNKTSVDVKGCTIYTTLFPSNECAKVIIQSGIRSMVYLSDKYAGTEDTDASRALLDNAGVTHKQFQSTSKEKLRVLLENILKFIK